MSGCGAPWWVVGGWAIDLAMGRETREHEDLEIGIGRVDFPVVRRHIESQGFEMRVAGDDEIIRLGPDETPETRKHQNWVFDPAVDLWRLDVMLEPADAETWRFRRDPRIRAPRSFMIADGDIAHLKPHGVLLFKAKAARPKDEADLATAAPTLTREQRTWLIEALELVHPGHAWIEVLAQA
jgi:hypothetical protein